MKVETKVTATDPGMFIICRAAVLVFMFGYRKKKQRRRTLHHDVLCALRCCLCIAVLIRVSHTGITLFAHAFKWIVLNVSETRILTLTQIPTACKHPHYVQYLSGSEWTQVSSVSGVI